MKKSGWIVFLILILLIVALFLLWRCQPWRAPAPGCDKGKECGVALTLTQPGVSIWSDGTVSIAAPIENDGLAAAANVRVTSIALGSSPRVAPVTLPAALGELTAHKRAVVQTQFKPVAVPGDYVLTVSGTYESGGATKPFTGSWPLKLAAPATGPFQSTPITLPKQHGTGVLLPPQPIRNPVSETNPVGPPIPLGPRITPFSIAPTSTPITKAPAPGASAGGVTIVNDTQGTVGNITNVPPDPDGAAASGANVVLQTDNSFLQVSTNGGTSFPTTIDPTTVFPQTDGGLCCDQVTIYDPNHNLIFWLLQYNSGGSTNSNLLRLAWATPEAISSNPTGAWTWIDLTQTGFKSGGGLDYPDLALSNGYIYVSVDGSDSANKNGGLIVSRWSLADIVGSGSSVGGAYVGVNELGDQTRAHGSHLAQNSSDGAYWAGAKDASDLEVFHWPDSSGSVSTNITQINNWCTAAADYANLAPDGQQWPDTGHLGGDGDITGATRQLGANGGHGKLWFGWTAGRDGSDCSQTGRPMPFVKIVQVDDQTLNSVGEYHIWNSPYAFGYVALGTSPSGEIGVSVAYAGPSNYPSSTVGYLGDYVVYYVEESDLSLRFYTTTEGFFSFSTNPGPGLGSIVTDSNGNPVISTRYGDFFTVRNSGPRGTLFTSQGYAVVAVNSSQSTSCLTAPGCAFHTHFEQWGRAAPKTQ